MPGKHVRFADTNTYHSSPPIPLFSDSPLPSPSDLMTPPPLKHVGSPYSYTPLPPVQGHSPSKAPMALGPVRIHAALGYAPHPTFAWDMVNHPSSSHTPLPARILAEPATSPPLPSLTIISPHLPWSIIVQPSQSPKSNSWAGGPAAFVTVADVLSTLYRALRLSVLPAEYSQLPSHEAKDKVNYAYQVRTQGSAEARKGVKRVDFLGVRKTFLGLSSTHRGPDIWMLNVT